MSTAQFAILSKYDDKDSYTLKELMDSCSIDKDEIKSSLLKLCSPNKMVLIKEFGVPTFDNLDEVIKINMSFNNAALKHNLVPMKTA